MNIGLVGGLFDAIGELIENFFGSMFDVIPKSIYLLAAVFLSVVDVLQCLVRKLAGLDIYWTTYSDKPQIQVDPLTEFIYGILGYGNDQSVAIYKGLNSVFLSLAVFAVICLVITSMIAIIKSHYNEDVAGTNPWKYIYTAIKAVFTFAIIPFVTVIGLKLSSWALQTLDGIVASSATEESMKSMYGENVSKFHPGYIGSWSTKPPDGMTEEDMEDATKYYARYDMFGLGIYTSSTPFSGMLFKACAYTGNRARQGYADGGDWEFEWISTGGADPGTGIVFYGGERFKYFGIGNGLDGANSEGSEDQGELVAQQVDYAFMNNLCTDYVWMGGILAMDAARYWPTFDIIGPVALGTNCFSKFHVGLVWSFYNLWEYNYIVAFAGGTTMVGIMLSVIIGLMSRLLKSAVLFLIYPALLGIAPLDNFKAFKSWSTQFIQQIMMAFGAIIGMNLTLLILPYANNFKFFNLALVDALVNCIIVITGLMMMKDIIAMISNFAGGADANAAGSALKGEVGKAFAGGAKTAGKLGLKATKFAGKFAAGQVKGIKGLVDRRKMRKNGGLQAQDGGRRGLVMDAFDRSRTADQAADVAGTNFAHKVATTQAYKDYKASQIDDLKKSDAYKNASSLERTNMEMDLRKKLDTKESKMDFYNNNRDKFNAPAFNQLHTAASEYANKQEAANVAKTKAQKMATDMGYTLGSDGKVDYSVKRKGTIERGGDNIRSGAEAVWNNFSGGLKEGYTQEKGPDGGLIYKDANGVVVDRKTAMSHSNPFTKFWDEGNMKNAGKELADGFLKSLSDISSSLNLDKMLKGMSDIFKEGTTFKGGIYDKEEKKEGDALLKDQHKEAEANAQKRSDKLEEKIEKLGAIIKEDLPGSIKVAFTEALKGASFTAGGTGSGTSRP